MTIKIQRKYLLDVLQKLFLKANVDPLSQDPNAELKKIDWTIIKAELTLSENLHALVEKYPRYSWTLYPSVSEILADEIGIFDVEIKRAEQKSKNKIYVHGKIAVTLPQHLIGSHARIIIIEPIEQYIQNWTARVRGLQTLGVGEEKQKPTPKKSVEDFF